MSLKALAAERESDTDSGNSARSITSHLPGEDHSAKILLSEHALELEELDKNLFRSPSEILWKPYGARFIYGGQVIGQALVAAYRSVEHEFHIHSVHSYFILGGNNELPVIYHVERVRDGKSFATRSVKAVQSGRIIFQCLASFQLHQPSPLSHQWTMPVVPPPENCPDENELWRLTMQSSEVSEKVKGHIRYVMEDNHVQSFECRHIDPEIPLRLKPTGNFPRIVKWLRAKMEPGDHSNNLHRCVAAYLSDLKIAHTGFLPHAQSHKLAFITSLDHTLWFHEHFKADEWLLLECESPQSGNSRALVTGRLWKQDGSLAVSFAQEVLMRPKL